MKDYIGFQGREEINHNNSKYFPSPRLTFLADIIAQPLATTTSSGQCHIVFLP